MAVLQKGRAMIFGGYMRLKTYLCSALLVGGALSIHGCAGSGLATETGRAAAALLCATPDVSASQRAFIDTKVAMGPAQAPAAVINVHFHVINTGISEAQGDVPQPWIDDQIDELNNALGARGYSFALATVTRTTNPSWFNATEGSPEEAEMKQALHQGSAIDLNIYSIGGTVRGYSSYPWDYASAPFKDGVVVRFDTLPGGTAVNYNLGDSAIHEVGHWLGLYHTFEYGCGQKRSDGIGDTPAQGVGSVGCPVGQDTCPSKAGLDPIENYMDTSDDNCMTSFTDDQKTRMDRMWARYREGN